MKIRVVWCIHVAAFVFSVLVLSLSAFSHYRAIKMRWTSGFTWTKPGATLTEIEVETGQLFFFRTNPYGIDVDFRFRIDEDVLPRDLVPESFGLKDSNESRFLCFARFRGTVDVLDVDWKCSVYVLPLWVFLFLPITWLGGFYLLRLRRHIRARRA